jgi:hypothetical protein
MSLSPVSTTPAISCSPVSMTRAINLSPANNPGHGYLVIAGVVDTGDKFFTGVVDLSPVTTTLANSYRR